MSLAGDIQRAFSLIRQLQGALNGSRVIWGRVSSAGAADAGAGFTSARNGAGDYTVTFTTPFSAVPAFVATPNANAARFVAMDNAAPTASAVRIVIRNSAGTATDTAFHFHAIGLP